MRKLSISTKSLVLITIAVLLSVLMFCSSCSSNKCIYKKNYKKSNEYSSCM